MPPVAWVETQACNGLTLCAAVADSQVVVSGDYITVPPATPIHWFLGRSANLAEIQLLAGWDQVALAESEAVNALAADFTEGTMVPVHIANPTGQRQQLSFKADNGNNNEITAGVLLIGAEQAGWFGNPPPAVPFRIIQVASTTAGVASVWTAATMTYPSNLPQSGVMTVYGMRCKSASSYAFRFVMPNMRPGVPTQHSLQGLMYWFKNPFTMDLSNLPDGEILSSTTTAAHNCELAVIY